MFVESNHKFQPGISGNPKGRPRGSKSKSTQLVVRLIRGNVADVNRSEPNRRPAAVQPRPFGRLPLPVE
jgi:Family of unknown function (DUF5681)